jgi:hypothetical protein
MPSRTPAARCLVDTARKDGEPGSDERASTPMFDRLGAPTDDSPRREPWVEAQKRSSPGGAKDSGESGFCRPAGAGLP